MKMSAKTKRTLTGYAFLTPALIVFVTLILVPVITSAVLAFTEWNFFSGLSGLKFVGLQNFKKMFTSDRQFKTALVNTVIYCVATVPTSIFLALILAHVLSGRVYMSRFFRIAFFIPYISNMVALGAIFRLLFRSDGPVNSILTNIFHVEPVDWLVSSSLSRFPIILVMIYSGIGFCLIIYIAAMKNVSRDLYEAAAIDGASPIRQFFSITVPMISPTTFYLVIVRMINALQVFAVINVIAGTGSYGGSASIVTLIYQQAFQNYKFGYASAEAWVLVAFILVITLINFRLQDKWVHY